MAITKFFDRSKELITFTCQGELSFDEVRSALEAMYTSDDYEYARGTLWDLTNATLQGLTAAQIWKVGNIVRAHKDALGICKNAIVAQSDLNIGQSRMFEAQTYNLPFGFMVFRTMEEALHWLNEDEQSISSLI